MAPFGDGGVGCGDGGEALRGWDPLRSGSAPPTMEGAAAAAAAVAAERRVFGGGGDGASFFSGIDGLMFGARMDEVSRCRGAAGAQVRVLLILSSSMVLVSLVRKVGFCHCHFSVDGPLRIRDASHWSRLLLGVV